MRKGNKDEVLAILDYVKSTNLKGSVEIEETDFWWDLGGIFLHFMIDDRETTVCYSRRKSQFFDIGHFHEDNCNVISLIQNINNENNRVHIVALFGGSNFGIEQKTDKKKKSWLLGRHYYSAL